MNNAATGLGKKFLVVLNDNQMSICPRVGGMGYYLDKARMATTYNDWNKKIRKLLPSIPLVPNQRRVETIVVRPYGRERADRLDDDFADVCDPIRSSRLAASVRQSRGMMSGKRPTAKTCSYAAAPPVR